MYKTSKKIILVLIIIQIIFSVAIVTAQNTLTLVTDPPEVLTIDPEALTMTLTDCPNVPVYIIDAKQTVTSGDTTYEFVGWGEGTEDWPGDPEEEPVLTGNQAFVILDASRTITAYYTTPNTLTLVTDPPEVLTIDPEALTMTLTDCPNVPVYIIDAKQTVTSGDTTYEFVGWGEGTEDWPGDPEEEPVLTGNQAFVILDASRTITAIYEKIVEWKYTMADENTGAILNINTDTKQFQFSTPTKDFGVKQADLMIVRDSIVDIWHSDSDIRLTAFAITDPRIDFCLAVVRDRQTGLIYVLRDRIGQE